MPDSLKDLPIFRWRGRAYAVTSRRVSFRQGNVEHALERRDNAKIESTGTENILFEYSLAVRDGLISPTYAQAFTEGYRILFADCLNSTVGELIDPVLGARLCKVQSLDDLTDPKMRDGTAVTVQFVHDPADDEDITSTIPTAKSVDSQASNVAAVAIEAIEFAETDPVAPVQLEEQESLIDILSAAEQIVNAPRNILNQFQGAANRSAVRLQRIIGVSKTLESYAKKGVGPVYWNLEQQARTLRDSANSASANRSQVEPVRVALSSGEQTVSSLALSLGVSVDALLKANPRLSRYPIIPSGFDVVVPNERT